MAIRDVQRKWADYIDAAQREHAGADFLDGSPGSSAAPEKLAKKEFEKLDDLDPEYQAEEFVTKVRVVKEKIPMEPPTKESAASVSMGSDKTRVACTAANCKKRLTIRQAYDKVMFQDGVANVAADICDRAHDLAALRRHSYSLNCLTNEGETGRLKAEDVKSLTKLNKEFVQPEGDKTAGAKSRDQSFKTIVTRERWAYLEGK